VPVQVSYYTSFTLSHSTYPEAVKTLKIYITVSNISPKYDTYDTYYERIVGYFFGKQCCEVELENSAKPCHFPHGMVRNCAKTNVPTMACLTIPQPVLVPHRVLEGRKVCYIVKPGELLHIWIEDLAQIASLKSVARRS